jgi:hypothetical protein
MQDAIVPGDADSPLPNLGETAFSDGSRIAPCALAK